MSEHPSEEPLGSEPSPAGDDMKLTDENLDDFARQLQAFGARSQSLDREALIFAAGQATVHQANENPILIHHVRLWKLSTLALTVLSFTLSSMLIGRTSPTPQIVYVNQTTEPARQNPVTPLATPSPDQTTAPGNASATGVNPGNESQDSQLAEAWKARRDAISANTGWEQSLATSIQATGHDSTQEQLTRSSLLGAQSQVTMQRWLKEEL